MKTTRVLIFVLITVLNISGTKAQTLSYPKFINKETDFSSYVYNTLSKDLFLNSSNLTDSSNTISQMKSICTKAAGTIQLYFSQPNKINKVKITGKCPDVLKEELTRISINSETLWRVPKDCYSKNSNKRTPIVIPYFIHVSDGCKELYNDPRYLMGRGFKFGVFLNSTPNNNIPIKCYLLDPVYLVSDDGTHEITP